MSKETGTNTWSYRVTREVFNGEESFSIREVYEDADGNLSWTDSPTAASGDTLEDVAWALDRMKEALQMDVLDI